MLLDTSFIIDFLKGKENAIEAIKKFDKKQISTTEINVFELMTGVYALKSNVDIEISKVIAFLSALNVLALDRKASIKAGEILGNLIKGGKVIEQTDCLIAGIALSNGICDILTGNKKHFERIPNIKVITY